MTTASPPAALSLAIAAQDIREAIQLFDLPNQVAVLMLVLVERGRASGDVPLFLALVNEALRERLALPPGTAA